MEEEPTGGRTRMHCCRDLHGQMMDSTAVMVCMVLRHRQSLRHAEEGKDEECVAKQGPLVFSSLMCLTLYTLELTMPISSIAY